MIDRREFIKGLLVTTAGLYVPSTKVFSYPTRGPIGSLIDKPNEITFEVVGLAAESDRVLVTSATTNEIWHLHNVWNIDETTLAHLR